MPTDSQYKWLDEKRDDVIFKFVALLISPVLGMLASLVRLNSRSSFIALFIAFTFIGLTMDVPEDRTEEENFDSIAYRAEFENFADSNSHDFTTMLSEYADMTSDTDFYSNIICFVVSRFSSNYHVFFMVVAILYSIFMLLTMRYLVREPNYGLSILCLILLFLFTQCQIQQINMYRFYTAYWIALLAIFKLIQDNNPKYWLLLIVTPIVHGSFFIIFLIFGIYYIIRRSNKLATASVILSLAFSVIAVEIFSWVILHLPESLGGHYSAYLNEWYIQRINEGGIGNKWMVRLMELAVRLSLNIVVLFFAWQYKGSIANSKCKNLYFFLMAVMSFVNFTFMIPSVGSRYVMFTFPLIAYIWLICFAPQKKWNWFIIAFSSIYLFYFLVLPWNIYQVPCFRYYTKLWNMDVLYGSPVYLFFKYIML